MTNTQASRMAMLLYVTLLALCTCATPLMAGSLLILEGNLDAFRYGGENWKTFSGYLDTETSNQITVTSDLSNLTEMLQYDAILVEIRYGYSFSETEVQNLKDYIETGRRVALVGDNYLSFTPWNKQLLDIVGGSVAGDFDANVEGTFAVTAVHPLTDGVDEVHVVSAAIMIGGTSLFEQNFAALWGDELNVLVILDSNAFDDDYVSWANNTRFAQNLAKWLATDFQEPVSTVVPSPAAGMASMLGLGLVAVSTIRRRRSR